MKKELDNVERKFEAKSQVLKKMNDDKAYGKANKSFTIKRDTLLTELEMIAKELKLIQAEEKAHRIVQAKRELSGVMKQIESCEDKEYLKFLKIAGKMAVSSGKVMYSFIDFEAEFYHQSEIEWNDDEERSLDYEQGIVSVRKCLNLSIERTSFGYTQESALMPFHLGYCGIKVDTYGKKDWEQFNISIRFAKELSEL